MCAFLFSSAVRSHNTAVHFKSPVVLFLSGRRWSLGLHLDLRFSRMDCLVCEEIHERHWYRPFVLFIFTDHFLQPCGVDYELKTYVAENPDEKPHKRYLAIFTLQARRFFEVSFTADTYRNGKNLNRCFADARKRKRREHSQRKITM